MADTYQVFDEMANETILTTEDKQKAINEAYNSQSVLLCNGVFVHDYSC